MRRKPTSIAALVLAGASTSALAALPEAPPAVPMVVSTVNDAVLTPLSGTVSALTFRAQDEGVLGPDTKLQHLRLWLNRPLARQAALDALTAAQTDPQSRYFRQWLTPAGLGSGYGPAWADITAVTSWLARHGFTVNGSAPTGMTIDFSGTAGQIADAFHTTIHHVRVANEAHIANLAEPEIPAALGGIVQGLSLNDFRPQPMLRKIGLVSQSDGKAGWRRQAGAGEVTIKNPNGGNYYAVTPADFATIYAVPTSGGLVSQAGIAVIEDSDMQIKDFNTFERAMIPVNPSMAIISHPGGCADPGLNLDESEAALDAEWAASVISSDAITVAACQATATTNGVLLAFENLVENGTSAFIVSISYGLCEQSLGLGFLRFWQTLTQEAAAEGLSVVVASGDTGPAGCENAGLDRLLGLPATTGRAVNGLAASPYVTAVGGTDFDDTARNAIGKYWNTTPNTSVLYRASALSYIPEIPWNDSCSSKVLTKFDGLPASPLGACGSSKFGAELFPPIGGGSGTSSYFARPAWQNVPGLPNTPFRVLPDVSLFAADGIWNHFLLFCDTGMFGSQGVPCTHHNGSVTYFAGGGTSFSAPSFASVVAGHFFSGHGNTPVGNLGPILYGLARLQFSNKLLEQQCGSQRGPKANRLCVFRSVNIGDNTVTCLPGTPDCVDANAFAGVVGAQNGRTPAYQAGLNYNQATGLGSLNVNNFWINFN